MGRGTEINLCFFNHNSIFKLSRNDYDIEMFIPYKIIY